MKCQNNQKAFPFGMKSVHLCFLEDVAITSFWCYNASGQQWHWQMELDPVQLAFSLSLHFQPLPTSRPCSWSSLCLKCSSPNLHVTGLFHWTIWPKAVLSDCPFKLFNDFGFWMDACLCFQTSDPLFANSVYLGKVLNLCVWV